MTGHSVDTRCEKKYTATDFYGTRADRRRGSILSSGTSGPCDLSAVGNQVLDLFEYSIVRACSGLWIWAREPFSVPANVDSRMT